MITWLRVDYGINDSIERSIVLLKDSLLMDVLGIFTGKQSRQISHQAPLWLTKVCVINSRAATAPSNRLN